MPKKALTLSVVTRDISANSVAIPASKARTRARVIRKIEQA